MNSKIPTLLIVEDDENDFLFLENAIAHENFESKVHHACDGDQAIKYLAGENDFADRDTHPLPSLIVLDLKLPGTDGFHVLEWIRAHPAPGTLPVVILSSSQEPQDIERAFALGAKAYLVKPSSSLAYSDVVQTLREFLLNGFDQASGKNVVKTFNKHFT